MGKFVGGIEYITESCCNCGISFAITRDFRDKRLQDKKTFYCPAGHGQHFIGKTEEEKRIQQLERDLNDTRKALGHERIERRDAQKQYAKIRQRVQKGQCPCCSETFTALRDHMASKHKMSAGEMLRTLRDAFGLTQYALEKETGVNASYISSFENSRYVPDWAEETLQTWMQNEAA